ncbi:hypothetical protein SAMN04489764_0131 [Thermostaphylospora chromogena]|uniref:Uncharacterized protein n=1 Tax=Thermostaphylospora chromogena TaxID=35622 RepID=A0A1H0ZTF2_9ACTN|nr:hypothetical protein SAMN04489764_0131 [Thermostaphylospora chromogena]
MRCGTGAGVRSRGENGSAAPEASRTPRGLREVFAGMVVDGLSPGGPPRAPAVVRGFPPAGRAGDRGLQASLPHVRAPALRPPMRRTASGRPAEGAEGALARRAAGACAGPARGGGSTRAGRVTTGRAGRRASKRRNPAVAVPAFPAGRVSGPRPKRGEPVSSASSRGRRRGSRGVAGVVDGAAAAARPGSRRIPGWAAGFSSHACRPRTRSHLPETVRLSGGHVVACGHRVISPGIPGIPGITRRRSHATHRVGRRDRLRTWRSTPQARRTRRSTRLWPPRSGPGGAPTSG